MYWKDYGCRVGKYNVILTNTACWTYNFMHNAMLVSVLVLLWVLVSSIRAYYIHFILVTFFILHFFQMEDLVTFIVIFTMNAIFTIIAMFTILYSLYFNLSLLFYILILLYFNLILLYFNSILLYFNLILLYINFISI